MAPTTFAEVIRQLKELYPPIAENVLSITCNPSVKSGDIRCEVETVIDVIRKSPTTLVARVYEVLSEVEACVAAGFWPNEDVALDGLYSLGDYDEDFCGDNGVYFHRLCAPNQIAIQSDTHVLVFEQHTLFQRLK